MRHCSAAERAPVHAFDVAGSKGIRRLYAHRSSWRGSGTGHHPLRPYEAGWVTAGSVHGASTLGGSAAAEGKIERATLYNLVGFQTNLKFGEQKRVFSMIPGLQHAEFMRYGVMHRNTFLNAPQVLNQDFSFKQNPNLFFAGQITGVEGYMESASSGILAGINAVNRKTGSICVDFTERNHDGGFKRPCGK